MIKRLALMAAVAVSLSVVSSPALAASTNAPVRPKIGLVLGGGGALGFAHIGVLRVLEEARVPVDYIAGTSMGSIIAGLYACGGSPDEIEKFLGSLDWVEVMSDQTPRRELFFRRKLEDQRFLFEMGAGWGRPKMGLGMAAGQKLNNVIQLMTLRAAAVTNFNDLPIPFRAVATDLESGKPYVMDHGNLARVMRASMAVPGAFTPVEIEGHLLVDGGVVNNLPVDVVKAMGADIIIAVDVGADADVVSLKELKSLGAILGRTYAIAQRPEQIRNFLSADVGIQPSLTNFTASDFDRVLEFPPEGEKAARKQWGSLTNLALSPSDYETYMAKQRRPRPTAIRIDAVEVEGNERVSESSIRGRIQTQPGDSFDRKEVGGDLMRIYGIGEFQQVTFSLNTSTNGQTTLVYDTVEKGWGPTYFKYGLKLQSDMEKDADWGMLLNLTRMSMNSLGGEWRNEIEFGSKQDIVSEFYQPLDSSGFLFVAPAVEYWAEFQDVYDGNDRVAEYDVSKSEARLDFGVQLRSYAELRAGPFWGRADAEVDTGATDLPEVGDNLYGYNTSLTVDRQDRTIFAREGYYFRTEGEFARKEMGGDIDYDKLSVGLRGQHSIGDHTVLLSGRYGSAMGTQLPGYEQFKLGGAFGFAGLAEEQFRGSALAIASLGYRYRLVKLPSALGRAVYAVTRYDTGNTWEDDSDVAVSDFRNGLALGLGADAALGPMFIGYGIAEGGYDRWYFSLGTAF